MIKSFFLSALALIALSAPISVHAAPAIGKPAPDFTGTDTNGKEHKLSDFKGKIIVLEWTNPNCPFVKKHYDSENMQTLQKRYTAMGFIWLSIASSAKGMEGYQTPEEANKYMAEKGSAPTARIIDADGTIGKLYGAKTTPHVFVIDKMGDLAYEGAIDDNDSANPDDAGKAKNYVTMAIDAISEDKPVTPSQTRPYGCSVKYAE